MPYTTAADGTRLFYKDMGTGPVVLLLHSWALPSEVWEYQLHPLLEAGYRVVAPDRRGHGRSDWAVTGLDADTLVDDITVVLEHAGVDEPAVVGHSMGGLEAVHLAARRGRVRGILLVAPFGPDMQGELGLEPLAANVAAQRSDWPGWFRAQDDAYFARPASGASDAMVDDHVVRLLTTPLEVGTTMMTEFWSTDVREEVAALGTTGVPVRILQGDADASAPLEHTGARYAELLPGDSLVVVPGAGHGLYATHATTVNAEMLAFLERCQERVASPAADGR